MRIRDYRLMVPLAIGMVLSIPAGTQAQEIATGQTAFDNLTPTTGRSPGGMVSAGMARAQEAVERGRSQIQITESAEGNPSPRAVFLVDAIEIMFDELNQLLAFFGNRLMARAGLTPLLPDDLVSGLVGGIGDGTAGDGSLGDLIDDLSDGSKTDDSTSDDRGGSDRSGSRKVIPR